MSGKLVNEWIFQTLNNEFHKGNSFHIKYLSLDAKGTKINKQKERYK